MTLKSGNGPSPSVNPAYGTATGSVKPETVDELQRRLPKVGEHFTHRSVDTPSAVTPEPWQLEVMRLNAALPRTE